LSVDWYQIHVRGRRPWVQRKPRWIEFIANKNIQEQKSSHVAVTVSIGCISIKSTSRTAATSTVLCSRTSRPTTVRTLIRGQDGLAELSMRKRGPFAIPPHPRETLGTSPLVVGLSRQGRCWSFCPWSCREIANVLRWKTDSWSLLKKHELPRRCCARPRAG
jgi:hypothetical protein